MHRVSILGHDLTIGLKAAFFPLFSLSLSVLLVRVIRPGCQGPVRGSVTFAFILYLPDLYTSAFLSVSQEYTI